MKRMGLLIASLSIVSYLILLLLPFNMRMKLYNGKRQASKIVVFEDDYLIKKAINSFIIYPNDSNSYFEYKIVEVVPNCLGIKRISFEEDHYRMNDKKMVCLYKWKYKWFSISSESVVNLLKYNMDSVRAPEDMYQDIEGYRYLSCNERDSFLYIMTVY